MKRKHLPEIYSALICRHQPPPPAVCLKHCGLVRRQLEMHVGQPCGVGGGYCGVGELIMYSDAVELWSGEWKCPADQVTD